VGLLLRAIKGGLPDVSAPSDLAPEGERPLGFAY
jgi:hypothetical protein